MGRRGMVINFAFVRTVGFLLTAVGFFMPVFTARGTGFDIAGRLMGGVGGFGANTVMGLLMYAVIVSAAAGAVIGILMLVRRRSGVSAGTGWIVLITCIASGLVVYFARYRGAGLQTGGILILIGWIAALVGQVLSRSR